MLDENYDVGYIAGWSDSKQRIINEIGFLMQTKSKNVKNVFEEIIKLIEEIE